MILTLAGLISEAENAKHKHIDYGAPTKLGDSHLISKYGDYLDTYAQIVKVDEVDADRYKGRPKLLSHDLYGTPIYWYILLYINKIQSPYDFVINSTIKLVSKDTITSFTKIIYDDVASNNNILKM